jgi:Alkylmercury lyase
MIVPMDERDLQIRNWIYSRFVETRAAPHVDDVAAQFGLVRDEAEATFRRLHDAHALVLEPGRTALLMLNPFSCVPTPYRVEAEGRWWYANCGWDGFGILAALGSDGHVSASCADCAEPIEIDVRGGRPDPADFVFHVLLPAERWWDDIVFN